MRKRVTEIVTYPIRRICARLPMVKINGHHTVANTPTIAKYTSGGQYQHAQVVGIFFTGTLAVYIATCDNHGLSDPPLIFFINKLETRLRNTHDTWAFHLTRKVTFIVRERERVKDRYKNIYVCKITYSDIQTWQKEHSVLNRWLLQGWSLLPMGCMTE